jgi:hypothetical protein
MAKTWGAQTWSAGTWSDQDSNAVELSGISLSATLGTLEFAGSVNGWGRAEWGSGAWGITGSVLAGGQSLSADLGTISVEALVEIGWGRGGWGNRAWGETYSVLPAGQQATLSQGTAIGKTDFTAVVTGLDLLTITQGLNSIQIDNDVFVFASEDQIDTAIGTVPSVTGTALVEPTGQSLSTSLGTFLVEPKIPVDVTGVSASLSLGSITLIQSTNESVTTAGLLTGSVGSIIPVSIYDVTGESLASSIGSVTITGEANIDVTGIGLTGSIGSVNITAWSEINPGVNNVWTTVDRAA